jgi:RNA polymerase sigma factor (sigma-70 family)
MSRPISDIFELIRACAAGDAAARRQFQDDYGEDIYYFPVKLHGLPLEKAGDFYVYVFENDRIFTRLRTFAGREDIQFRTFLSFFALKSLFLDWLRTLKEVETVPLPKFETDSTARTNAPLDAQLDIAAAAPEPATPQAVLLAPDLWNRLSPEERLDLKLLCLLECDLSLEETRLLASRSGRSLRETLLLVEEVRQKLQRKDEKLTQFCDTLDSIWGWILLRQKELKEIDEKLRPFMATKERLADLVAQKKAVEESLEKRYRQREKLLEEIRTYKLTTPYSDLAQLLNLTVGTVCSRIFRLRAHLSEEIGVRRRSEEGAS